MKKLGKSGGIPLDQIRLERLTDPDRAGLAMEVALEEFDADGDIDALLDTLRLIARAQGGGITGLARRTAVSRQALTEALSPEGNPRLRTFQSVLKALGLRMSLKPISEQFHAH